MKRILLIFLAVLSMATVQAQSAYLQDGDYVTISSVVPNYWDQTQNKSIDLRVYLEVNEGVINTARKVSDGCLWKLIANANGYALQNELTGLYLGVATSDNNNFALRLSQSQTFFRIDATAGVNRELIQGSLYYQRVVNHGSWNETVNAMVGREHNEPYSFIASRYNAYTTLEIERWEKKGGGDATSHFNPDKAVFEYVEDDNAAQAQATTVKFVLEASSESYYQCVCREEMLIGRQSEALDPSKVSDVSVSWLYGDHVDTKQSYLKFSNYTGHADGETERTLMTLSQITKNGNDWQFTITPNGKSPMGLMQQLYKEQVDGKDVYTEGYVDYVDWVIVNYKYNGKDFTQQMRVVRKSYHEENLPTLVLTVNPVNWTFGQNKEEKEFEVKAIHQHASVIYSVEKIVFGDTIYKDGYRPTPVTLTSNNLTLVLSDTWKEEGSDELSAELEGGKIKVSTEANGTEAKRSAVLTGTLCPVKEQDANHPCETFTINLDQRHQDIGGIKLIHQPGKGNTKTQTNKYGYEEQPVHTAERTIYYDDKEVIELRLPEAGYSGYMRWYDYETNGSPNFNHCHAGKGFISTSWDYAPQSAAGKSFVNINTPASSATVDAEGYSLGLYALNQSAEGSDGSALTAAILNEDQNDNPAPRIRPWSDNDYHIMACDVSAYTDYKVEVEKAQIKSITEPTLSYRQLFHMRPASEMADRFAALKEGEFLENYSYQAPAGKAVLLATEYRFNKYRSHISEMCYFYRDKSGTIKRITNQTTVVWTEYTLQNNGTYDAGRTFTPTYTSSLDYLKVQEDRYPVQKKYTLTVPKATANTDKDLLIACFEVKFLDIEKYGPTEKVIITQQRIETDYNLLDNINFEEYDSKDQHMPWDYTSYGYVYDVNPLNTVAGFKRGASQGVFPFYGEYTVVESVNKDWAKSSAHSGKALYVDGTMEPGVVATIAAPTNICTGQTVYCSAWLRNPRPQSDWAAGGQTANPIFRCNIQGRSKTDELDGSGKPIYTEWEDAGVYFVGELAIGSQWQQIVFPIESAHSYDETRVSIYNFATTNQGNDFMVDDINLYVSRLPIAAYQGKMACRSVDEEHTNAAAILRIDYSNIDAGNDGHMYYQIYNTSYENKDSNGNVVSIGAAVTLTGEAAYYHEAHTAGIHDHNDYGSVQIPEVNYDPEKDNKVYGVDYFYSVSKMLDYMVEQNYKHFKAYVKTENSGVVKWLLYVAHLIDHVTSRDINEAKTDEEKAALPIQKLYDEHFYVMRMAYSPEELPNADCNLTTPLHATQQTVFTLRNSDQQMIQHAQVNDKLDANPAERLENDTIKYIFNNSRNNCANDLYFLTSTVVNHLAVSTGLEGRNIAAPIYADWLVGDPLGDVFSESAPAQTNAEEFKEYQARLTAAEAAFKNKYGYTHGQVANAVMYDMRREPTSDNPNPNYTAKTFKELQSSAFESLQNYEIIRHLYENEWLQLYDTTVHFYLGSQDTARYWCFPIVGTAKTTIKIEGKDSVITVKDCNEPHRVYVTSASSNYFINITPIALEDMTAQQKKLLPTVMVVEGSESVTIPVTELGQGTTVEGLIQDKNNITLSIDALTFMDMDKCQPMAERPEQLKAGDEYVVRLQVNNGGCGAGYVFFNLQVLPKTMIWVPEGSSFNGWGKNENWKGWSDANEDGKVQSTELSEGFVPTGDVDVVISKLDNPMLYPYIVPDDEHSHYPMTVGFQPHHCKNIYFEPGAMIHNQHLLEYENAFVDMSIQQATWSMVSAPLQSVYSGDMYIPHRGAHYADASASSLESTDPFTVVPFSGSRKSDAPYAFWISYYNKAVKNWFDNGHGQDIVSNSAEFVQSNSMNEALTPGSGFMLLGFGPDNYSGSLTIRLPKSESVYYDTGGNKHNVPRNQGGKLAFTATNDAPMQITLTNKNTSNYFLFGNPTMAYINMHDFLTDTDNAEVVEHGFYHVENGSWDANAVHTMTNDRYLAPMTSVMLQAKSDTQKITVTLKPSHLTLNNQISIHEEEDNSSPAAAPKRVSSSRLESELLTIYAFTDDAFARTKLAVVPTASDYYLQGEDALFISSGVETLSEVTTPLNMYTVAEQVPMMADVRQGISEIPLAMLVDADYRAKYMQLAFYYSNNWSRTCYFCDSYTGQKIRIMDGLLITVEMPQNHEQRYYIEGPDTYNGSTEGGVATSTTSPTESSTAKAKFTAYSLSNGLLNIHCSHLMQAVELYDLAGRSLVQKPLQLLHNSCELSAPSGICIVKVTLRDGTELYQQALVR